MQDFSDKSAPARSATRALHRICPPSRIFLQKLLNFLIIVGIIGVSTYILMGPSAWTPTAQINSFLSRNTDRVTRIQSVQWRFSDKDENSVLIRPSTQAALASEILKYTSRDGEDEVYKLSTSLNRPTVLTVHQATASPVSGERLLHDLARGFSAEERARLSGLGRVLFLQESPPVARGRNFTIAVWRHGKRVERRLLRSYGNITRAPLQHCRVQNCRVVYADAEQAVDAADAVLFHLQFLGKPERLPTRTNLNNRWVFWSDESPRHAFTARNISGFDGVFNWSMAYRFDTDVPVPYGRTVLGPAPPVSHPHKTKLAAVLGSNCDSSGRWQIIKALKKLIPLDTFGKCGETPCPGHYDRDCQLLDDYKFYLSFENSHCDGYITEKVFWQALHKGAVPVVFGAPRSDYEKLLPPNSYIFAEDFGTVDELAQRLVNISQSPAEYREYHAWRNHFTVLNEHGYFGSPIHHYCRVCEALNYNSGAIKRYPRVTQFWGVEEHCTDPDGLFKGLK